MRRSVHHIRAVIVNPYGLASGDGDTRTGRRLNHHAVCTGVVDDVDLLNAGYDQIACRATSGADQVQTQVTCGLRGVYVGKSKGDVATGEGNIR